MEKASLFLFLIFILNCKHEKKMEVIRPNIVYILADDLGYGELGAYGQKIIETPNLDALAKSGMLFTQHYSGAPVCAPARCVLLTGRHTGHAYVRGNDEWNERGTVWDYEAMFKEPSLEGQRPLPDSILTVAEILQQAGYKTAAVGKWGLGAPITEGVPNRQGFDFFYGYNCQRQAHTYYPMHLWKNENRDLLDNKMVAPHSTLAENAAPNNSASYADFQLKEYAPDKMHQEALGFLDENKSNPFFLYYASPLPHLPLQAPQNWVDHYREKLGDEKPYTGNNYFPSQYPRATYAAMISFLDEQVGDLINKLKEMGVYENTLVIFSSDNGPTYTGGADTEFFESASPFITAKGRGKGSVYEGGIRVPMMAVWPDKIIANSHTDHISAFYDILPTICDLIGAPIPENADGISFLPILLGEENQVEHPYLYWEFPEYNGQQALRIGKWKAVRQNIKDGNLHIELYDLSADVQEQNDVSEEYPDFVEQLKTIFQKEHIPSSIERFKMEALGDVLAVQEN